MRLPRWRDVALGEKGHGARLATLAESSVAKGALGIRRKLQVQHVLGSERELQREAQFGVLEIVAE